MYISPCVIQNSPNKNPETLRKDMSSSWWCPPQGFLGRLNVLTRVVPTAGSDSHPDAVMARRQYLRWTPELQDRFLDAVEKLGGLETATPSRIAVLMQVLPAAILRAVVLRTGAIGVMQISAGNRCAQSGVECIFRSTHGWTFSTSTAVWNYARVTL